MKELLIIQSELKVPKSQFNEFGKYKYRNCEDILEAVKPLLKQTKTVLIISDEIIQVGDRYYVEAEAILKKEDGKEIARTLAYAREPLTKKGMDEAQITGASSSYARKYALNGLFAIDDTKDADTTNKGDPAPKETKPTLEEALAGEPQGDIPSTIECPRGRGPSVTKEYCDSGVCPQEERCKNYNEAWGKL